MNQSKFDFSEITQGYKKQFALIKKLMIELGQNIISSNEIDLV
ncbi:MAG: hypothetical protein ACTSP3_11130 [Candidatus Heimdallarchaeaceae archaeon]